MKKTAKVILYIFLSPAVILLLLLGVSGIGPLKKLNSVYASTMDGNKEAYSFSGTERSSDPILKDKNIAVLGSSVAFGAMADGSSVGEYLVQRFDAVLHKEAVSSTTLSDIMPWSYVRRIEKLNDGTDYNLFLCQLSTNDSTLKVELGEIAKGKDMGQLDRKTVTGALEYIILYAEENFDCPVVFFTGSYFENAYYEEMVKRLKELQNKYEFGILDLYGNEEFNRISDQERKLYMHDDIHPTKAGYRDWWGPEMEKQLLEYLKGE
ncbi:MAG: SGNH/GDSL hydrolase family protein [Erysipelotrichaceae bacterium]|nr:SGNH/GDSL hydrolase family protein [Erysipelotrichaceae bacterium]